MPESEFKSYPRPQLEARSSRDQSPLFQEGASRFLLASASVREGHVPVADQVPHRVSALPKELFEGGGGVAPARQLPGPAFFAHQTVGSHGLAVPSLGVHTSPEELLRGVEESPEPPDQVANVQPLKHPHKCFDVSHNEDAGQPGMKLRLRQCPDPHHRDEFVIPRPGHMGVIKPVKYPFLCLHIDETLSFQPCAESRSQDRLWIVRNQRGSRFSHVYWAADVRWCVSATWDGRASADVSLAKCEASLKQGPNGELIDDGNADVDPTQSDQTLHIREAPVDCIWHDWSDWSACSRRCDGGHQRRVRKYLQRPQLGGLPCEGDWKQVVSCDRGPCGDATSTTTTTLSGLPTALRGPSEQKAGATWLVTCFLSLLGLLMVCLILVCVARNSRVSLVMVKKNNKVNYEKADLDSDGSTENSRAELLDPQRWVAQLKPRQDGEGRARSMQRHESASEDVRASRPVEPQVMTCAKRHNLTELKGARSQRKWKCDGPAGCAQSRLAPHAMKRYRCEACDFDVCAECYGVGKQRSRDRSGSPSPGGFNTPRRWQERQLAQLSPGCTASVRTQDAAPGAPPQGTVTMEGGSRRPPASDAGAGVWS